MLEGTGDQDRNNLNAPMGDMSCGIDAALGYLSIGMQDIKNSEKKRKGLHKVFEERMMPEMKSDYPGLKMSQYKERFFTLWKKSPENPTNQQP